MWDEKKKSLELLWCYNELAITLLHATQLLLTDVPFLFLFLSFLLKFISKERERKKRILVYYIRPED